MAMYISIDDERIRIKRSDEEVGGTFWKVDGPNASCVFEVAWRAKMESDKHGYIYDVLKASKTLKIRRNNAYGDAIIFAATGVVQALKTELKDSEYENAWKEAHDRNNSGEFDEFYLLYAS